MSDKPLRDGLTADWFASDHDPARLDPVHMAQKALKPQLPARFYKGVSVEGGRLLLDGRPARTPGKHPLIVPPRAAEALKAEWEAQESHINPATMPLTRLVNSIIDGVLPDPVRVADDAARYAASDLLCYRAESPQKLVDAQNAAWNPVIAFADTVCGGAFRTTTGVGFIAQDDAVLAGFRHAMPTDPWQIGAFHVVTTLTGSALLALALNRRFCDADTIWAAAQVDEDVQMQLWGSDEEAVERRVTRRREFDAAVLLV